MLNACSSIPLEVTLPAFPEAHTEYSYRIMLPEGTTEAVIFWYYGIEQKDAIIYTSGVVPIRTGIISTEMYFPWRGAYILTVYAQTKSGIKKQRHKYAVRWKPI